MVKQHVIEQPMGELLSATKERWRWQEPVPQN